MTSNAKPQSRFYYEPLDTVALAAALPAEHSHSMNHIFLNQYLNAVATSTTGRTFDSGESYSTQTVGGLKFSLYRQVEAHGNVEIY